jgi:hypothetical protein
VSTPATQKFADSIANHRQVQVGSSNNQIELMLSSRNQVKTTYKTWEQDEFLSLAVWSDTAAAFCSDGGDNITMEAYIDGVQVPCATDMEYFSGPNISTAGVVLGIGKGFPSQPLQAGGAWKFMASVRMRLTGANLAAANAAMAAM